MSTPSTHNPERNIDQGPTGIDRFCISMIDLLGDIENCEIPLCDLPCLLSDRLTGIVDQFDLTKDDFLWVIVFQMNGRNIMNC